VLYAELIAASILFVSLTFVPHFVTLSGLRASRKYPFHLLSTREILLISIVIGELIIIIPTSTIGFISSIQISAVYFTILALSLTSAIVVSAFSIRANGFPLQSLYKQSRDLSRHPEFLFAAALIAFYFYIISIVPVDLSYDAANYFLPYSQGLLKNGFIPLHPFASYSVLGGQPSLPPGVSSIYAYAINLNLGIDSFRLIPAIFLIQLCLGASLIGKEVFPKLRSIWIFIICLVSPSIFFYLTTTPYNSDLLFSSFFISAILYIIKSKRAPNILWSLMAGGCACGMVLTKDVGLTFLLPLLSLILLGQRRIGQFWIVPFALQLLIPISFLLNETLFTFYLQHSIAVIIVQALSLALLVFASRSFSLKHNLRGMPLALTFAPAIIFLVINTTIWGSPVVRTYVGFFSSSQTEIDYPWASDIAVRKLGVQAFPVEPQQFAGIFLNIGYIFVAPVLGGLFLIPKIFGIMKIYASQEKPWLYVILLTIVTTNWISIFGGFNYDDFSSFRHTLDVSAILSILVGIGMLSFVDVRTLSGRLKFLIVMAVILAIHVLVYFQFNPALLSLNSRIISDEPFYQFIVYSCAIFIWLKFSSHVRLGIKPLKIAAAVLFFILVTPYFVSSAQVIGLANGSYESVTKDSLSVSPVGSKMLAVQDYFNEKHVEGRIMAYGIDWLAYRTGHQVLEMRTIIDLAIMKEYLLANDTAIVVNKLKGLNVQYIVVPISGESFERFKSLYGETKIFDLLTDKYTFHEAQIENIAIFRLK
jgi:hypothetical protein